MKTRRSLTAVAPGMIVELATPQGLFFPGAINVRILQIRRLWGRMDVLIEPEAGWGRRWVSVNRIRAITPESMRPKWQDEREEDFDV